MMQPSGIENRTPEEQRTLFFRKAAHEVRNPLHLLGLSIDCLADGVYGPLTEEVEEAVTEMQQALARATITAESFFAMELKGSATSLLRPDKLQMHVP